MKHTVNKFVKLTALSSILTFSCLSAQADLHIFNFSTLDKISVKCGTVPGVPIKKQDVVLRWDTIKAILNKKTSGTCDFLQGSKHLALASLEMNPNLITAKITRLELDSGTPLKVTITPGVGIESKDIYAYISDI